LFYWEQAVHSGKSKQPLHGNGGIQQAYRYVTVLPARAIPQCHQRAETATVYLSAGQVDIDSLHIRGQRCLEAGTE
jgi:hypothetical protein